MVPRPPAAPSIQFPEFPLKASPLQFTADWHYERSGRRQHYLIEAHVDDEFVGRAHGWFEPGSRFVLEKIEMTPRHRSKGYGTALIGELRAKAREKDCSELVFQGVRSANRGAIKLYRSMGAHAVPRPGDLYEFVISPP